MKSVTRRTALLLGTAGLLSACTSPNPQLYTLAPVPGTARGGGPHIVVLHQVSIARYLERPEIVQSSENYRLNVLSNEIWGEPLAQMIGRVLSADLTQRLPGTTVYSVSGAISAPEDASVEVNIDRMDKNAAGALAFSSQAAVEFTAGHRTLTRALQITVPVASVATSDEVQAMSIAIGQLADLIAAILREAPRPARAGRA